MAAKARRRLSDKAESGIADASRPVALVPDLSVITDRLLSKGIAAARLRPEQVILHEALVAFLERESNENRAAGFLGLREIERLRGLAEKTGFKLDFLGERPRQHDLINMASWEIDSLARALAFEEGAALVTSNVLVKRLAEAKGIAVVFLEAKRAAEKRLKLEGFFDESTMSIHLKEGVAAWAKKGYPSSWSFSPVSKKALSREDIQEISREIIENAKVRDDGFVEIERQCSTIVQLGSFRIVISMPPLSDGWEITAVRPVKRLSLADYRLSEKLMKRVSEQAEGILIAGSPGAGKSTFAQALAEYYFNNNRIVKTVEAPRDLVLPNGITRYSISHGDQQEIHDILLLSRPDYTVFDEMRNTSDFQLFADMRLAGIGIVGVVHATKAVDAIQRFIGRIELGVIPQIIDTVIFVKDGFVSKVLSLNMTVKVPSGMSEADLARPVVVVNDFETKKLEFEIYSYGEETVVMPVRDTQKSPVQGLAARAVEGFFKQYSDDVRAEMLSEHSCVVHLPSQAIAKVIGRQGKNIEQIEKSLGISIDVREMDTKSEDNRNKRIMFDAKITKKHVVLSVDSVFSNKNLSIYIEGDYLMSANVGKQGVVKISRKNKIGKVLVDAINMKEDVALKPASSCNGLETRSES